ncbi:MAG: preprotein translocase subunit SecG [Planctomycetota bacterium]|jgi:preprotein translocase subunit SecG
MIAFPVLAASFIMKMTAGLFIVCSAALVLIILIQKGRGGGLSSAFGGGMAGGILGSKTGDFLTWVTIVLVGVFLTLAVVMAKFYKPAISDFAAGTGPPSSAAAEQQAPKQPPRAEPLSEAGSDVNLPGS